MNSSIKNFPQVDFLNGLTIDKLIDDMVKDYQAKYKEITGKEISLAQADPYRMIMYACAVQIYQGMRYADRAGKLNFLKYSYGSFLDNVGTLRGVSRNDAAPAVTTIRFSIASTISSAVSIPAGTRVTNGNEIYFFTDDYAEIPAGSTYIDVAATCTEDGQKGNGFRAGEINILVETLPYITSAVNTTETAGGADIEDDEALADRIYLASSAYSVAGPADAYVYWAKTYSQKIGDVKVTSPSAAVVNVRFLMDDSSIPTSATIAGLQTYLADENIRPLTDQVTVLAPETEEFDVEFTYYINRSDTMNVAAVQAAVQQAAADYVAWQIEKIGRDINPSELVARVMAAGAKRVTVTSPEYTEVIETTVPRSSGTVTITYGGVEND